MSMKKYDIKRIVGEGIIYPKLLYSTNLLYTYRKMLSLYLSTISIIFHALYDRKLWEGSAMLSEGRLQAMHHQADLHAQAFPQGGTSYRAGS